MNGIDKKFVPFMVFFILGSARVSIEPSMELLITCPGRSVSLNCSVEPLQVSIFWTIWCECRAGSSGSCRDICSPDVFVSTGDRHNTGSVCASTGDSPAITYSNNFTTIVDQNGNMFVPFSALTIAVPAEFQQLNTRLCITCEGQLGRYLLVPGVPSRPSNLTFYPQYTTATDTEILVNFMWLHEPFNEDSDIEYTITFTDDSGSSNSTFITTVSNVTVTLEFSKTYSVIIYTSRCNGTLTSDSLITNITIDQDTSCIPPSAPPGVNISVIVAGFLLLFQCEEGLVPEELLETRCGADGIWTPDPTLHVCINETNGYTHATSTVPTQREEDCGTPVLLITTVTLSVITIVLLSLNVVTFTLGVFVGRRTKKPVAVSTTVGAPQSEAVSAAIISEPASGIELEKVHEYEDIVLHEKSDVNTFTSNVAYGCS